MRISDWSSDVCSSDLRTARGRAGRCITRRAGNHRARRRGHEARRMSERPPKRSFASRPADPESWIKAPDRPSLRADVAAEFTARLPIDVTADLPGRIKTGAFQRGPTVAELLAARVERETPKRKGK